MQFYPKNTFLLISTIFVVKTLTAPTSSGGEDKNSITQQQNDRRHGKNLLYFDYVQPEVDYDNYGITNEDYPTLSLEENDLSRAIPTKKLRRPQYSNSPIYYIRLPPQPYMFVPGFGYISQPPQNPLNQFVNVPVNFVSNGKPNSIYQWSGGYDIPTVAPPPPPPKPKPVKKPLRPDSPIHKLTGQFSFNGKPENIFVLQDSYNSLYSDVLQNLYP